MKEHVDCETSKYIIRYFKKISSFMSSFTKKWE